ncbi:hypothetical protein CEXT_403251 [Caerostris extrusa]|uniref:Uncharacterized protein n=1 Tax=Caerostris extrusa TaxID=172846 RepID=A0AAV4XID5_CAEEX|nr:hypothetical protein CEXT_403251 [Caerostris extrusa]
MTHSLLPSLQRQSYLQLLGCPRNQANFVPAPPPKTNYWEERMKTMKANKLLLSAPTSLKKTTSTNSVKMENFHQIKSNPKFQVLPLQPPFQKKILPLKFCSLLLRRSMFSLQT